MELLSRQFRFYLLFALVSKDPIEVRCAPSSGSYSSVIEAIEAAVASLPQDSLSLDKILIQWLHRVNAYTTYHDAAKGQNSPALFTRKTIDTDKDILVLGSDEDHLPLTNFKRTFVVLKRHSSGEAGDSPNAEYKIFYAYVRDAKEQDPLAVAVGNQKIRIEFDNWDGRGSSTNPVRSLGWTSCFESIYPTCKTEFADAAKNESEPLEGADDIDYSSDQDDNIENSTTVKRNRTRVSNLNSGDSNYYDLFADLDDSEEEKEFIRKTVGAFTWSMSSFTVLAPPEELLEKGFSPKNPNVSAEVQSQIKVDAEQALKLLEEITESPGLSRNNKKRSAESSPNQGGSIETNNDEQLFERDNDNSSMDGRFFGLRWFSSQSDTTTTPTPETESSYRLDSSGGISATPAPVRAPKLPGYLVSITDSLGLKGNDLIEISTNLASTLGWKYLGLDGMGEAVTIFVDSYNETGHLSAYKLATGMGGFIIKQGLKRFPIIGDALIYASKFIGPALRTLGSFFSSLAGRNAGQGANGESPSDTNLFGRIGWRTADISSEDLHTQSEEVEGDTPFIGFGKCPREIVKLSDFDENNATGKLIKLYLSVVRTQCSLIGSAQIFKLFVAQILQIAEDKTVTFNTDLPLLSKPKLSLYEAYDLSAAVEFSVFTKTLMSEWRNPTAPVGPDGSKITKTVHVFIQSALNAINEANKLSGSHFIKLVRNVVITLKTGFTELLQDYDRYKACSICPPELIQTSKNDLTAINALMQFIVVGLRPVDQVGQDVKEVFQQFYKNNQPIVDEKVKMFL